MIKTKFNISALALCGAVCLLLVGFYNFSFWQQVVHVARWPFMISIAILIASAMYGLLLLLGYRYTFKPILIFAFLVATISSYAMDRYGYIISTQAFQNIVETDHKEVYDLISWHLILWINLGFILPVVLISAAKITYPAFKIRLLHIILCLLLMFANILMFNKHYASLLRNNKEVRYYLNPLRPMYSMAKYTNEILFPNIGSKFQELDPAPTKVAATGKPKLVVLVIGESDRAMNQSLNGYARQTNPRLAAHPELLSFKNVTSCGTQTSVSVPCMFSAFKREEYTDKKGRYTENVLDLLQKSSVQVLWRDNDSGCKHVCDRVLIEDFNYADIKPYCNEFECHDEVLLHNLQEFMQQKPGDKLIVLHKKGNHGPAYYKRYPKQFAQFGPTCETGELHNCTDAQITNTYDNIVLYTDYFLDHVITQLKANSNQYQTALIYISDHGESLGENGVYLHAMPYWMAPKEQIHVPMFFWSSPDFAIDRNKLLAALDSNLSHDNLFHSLLGIFNVQSNAYIKDLDIFAG